MKRVLSGAFALCLSASLALAQSTPFGSGTPTAPFSTVPASGAPGTAPSMPVFGIDDERAAFKAGRMYVLATGNNGVPGNLGISVPAGSYLNNRICNGGTKPWYIAAFGRFLDTSSASATPYGGIANPDALTTAQAATLTGCGAVSPNTCNLTYGSNLLPGAATQTDVSMSFGVGSIMTVGGANGVPSGTGIIYPGSKTEISKPRALPPGKCFGQYLVGQSTGLTGATAIFLGYRVYIYSDQ